MKLVMGTAQFGLDYGVTNPNGAVNIEEITKILNYARNNDILTIDTASSYGNSENKLGSATDLSNFNLITKTPPGTNIDLIQQKFYQSLKNLNLQSVYGLLIHSPNDLLSAEGDNIWKLLEILKNKKLVKKIGVSVYKESEIIRLLERYEIDIIQLPINVFDQRLLQSNILEELKNKKIEIHARSLFLQGILLAKTEDLPTYFSPYKYHIAKWHDFLEKNNLSAIEGAINFAYSLNLIDHVVIGITSLNDLMETKTAFDKAQSLSTIQYSQFAISDEKFINPTAWSL